MRVDQKALSKIAKLQVAGVAQEDICDVMGLTAEQLTEATASADFKSLSSRMLVEQVEQDELLNGGWDTVESLALTAVVKNLQLMPDPKYALAAAQVANKAQRRSSVSPKLITPQNGKRFSIRLEQIFVNGLRGGLTPPEGDGALTLRTARIEPRKQQDFLPLNKVEEILTHEPEPLPAHLNGAEAAPGSTTVSQNTLDEVTAPEHNSGPVAQRFVFAGEFDSDE